LLEAFETRLTTIFPTCWSTKSGSRAAGVDVEATPGALDAERKTLPTSLVSAARVGCRNSLLPPARGGANVRRLFTS